MEHESVDAESGWNCGPVAERSICGRQKCTSLTNTSCVRRSLLPAALLVLALPFLVCARDAFEQKRIDYLLHSVETIKGATFIRNGAEYDGAAAVKHLKSKLNYGGDRIKTAEDFVKYCASESSLTHRKYGIRLPDGAKLDGETFFTQKLHEFDELKQ